MRVLVILIVLLTTRYLVLIDAMATPYQLGFSGAVSIAANRARMALNVNGLRPNARTWYSTARMNVLLLRMVFMVLPLLSNLTVYDGNPQPLLLCGLRGLMN